MSYSVSYLRKRLSSVRVIRRLELLGWSDETVKTVKSTDLRFKVSRHIHFWDRYINEEGDYSYCSFFNSLRFVVAWEKRKHIFFQILETALLKVELPRRLLDCQPFLFQIREDYAQCNPVNTIIPPLSDIYSLAPFRSLIRNAPLGTKLTLGHFCKAIDQLPSLISTWVDVTTTMLLREMHEEGVQLDVSDLVLATALFDCTYCGRNGPFYGRCDRLISYPRVLVHRGAKGNHVSSNVSPAHWDRVYDSSDWDDSMLDEDNTPQNTLPTIQFSKDIYERVTFLVQLCGLNPLTTTAHQMDELNLIFTSTNYPYSSMNQRHCMTWRRTASIFISLFHCRPG